MTTDVPDVRNGNRKIVDTVNNDNVDVPDVRNGKRK